MKSLYIHCPNPGCRFHEEKAPPRWYQKWGYFRERANGQLVPRYRCRYCRRSFSASTFKTTYRQKRPDINEALRRALSEGMGVRPATRAFQVDKRTILRKLKFLGELSEQICREKREGGKLKTNYVQFDEMFTYERSKCLPVSVAIAVRPKTGEIISARAGGIPCNNALQRVSLKKFGIRKNDGEKALRLMLRDIAECVRNEQDFTLASDSDHDYRLIVKDELAFANYERYVGEDLKKREKALRRAKAMATVDSEDELIDYSSLENIGPFWTKRQKNGKTLVRAYDPIFAVNQKCMKLRASLSRMRRDYWGYTQKIENLQLHLWLFIALQNGYELPERRKMGPAGPAKKSRTPVEKPPSVTTFDLTRLTDAKGVECNITRRSVILVPTAFARANGLPHKPYYRAQLDSEMRIVVLSFHDSPIEDARKVTWISNSPYIYIGEFLREAGFKVLAGRVQILWDERQKCAFVVIGDLLAKRDYE